MKIIIAGSRDFTDYRLLLQKVDDIIEELECDRNKIIIVSGGARGADLLGEKYADECGFPVAKFEADWDKHGKSAGYKRNKEMAKYGDVLIAFWDGQSKGTGHMIDLAKNHKLKVYVINV